MANCKSAKKAVRKIAARTAKNRNRVSKIRTFVKKVEQAIKENNKSLASENLKIAQSQLMKGVHKGVVKKNTASRKISRLSAQIKKIA